MWNKKNLDPSNCKKSEKVFVCYFFVDQEQREDIYIAYS